MSSSWGLSWGKAWGNAWGMLSPTPPLPSVGGGSAGGGGSTSRWRQYTYEKARRYEEVFQKLLAAERKLEAKLHVPKVAVESREKLKRVRRLKARLVLARKQAKEFLLAAAEEEFLMMALLA